MNPLEKLLAENRNVPRRRDIVAAGDDVTDVYLYDGIGGYFGIDAGVFVRELQAIKTPKIRLRVNSPGGDVNAARAIATAISQHPSEITAHVDGLAASAASVLILAAKAVEMSAGAFIMVHQPWTVTVGNVADHAAAAERLGKYGDAMAADYARRTGKSLDEVTAWMDAETWFSADEAVEAGLADRVVETISPKNEWNLSAYRNTPAALGGVIAAAATAPGAPQPQPQASPAPGQEGQPMNENQGGTPPAAQPAAEVQAAIQAERQRGEEIRRIGAATNMPADQIAAAVASGETIEAFRARAVDAMAAATAGPEIRGNTGIDVQSDAADKRRTQGVNALLNRVSGSRYAVDGNNMFRRMSLIRMAEECMIQAGLPTRGKSPAQIAVQALHSTSDFPYILENAMGKVLLDAYGAASPTYRIWAKQTTMPDFKQVRRIRRGEAPGLLEVPEGGEIEMGTMGESRESYALATYGRGIDFTRQMIVNDDLQAFNDLYGAFGLQCARLENKSAYAVLASNPQMADGTTLFHADHGNLGAGAIGNTGLGAMYSAMALQKGIDGETILNISPKWLVTSPKRKAEALQSQIAVPVVKASDQNLYAGMLTPVSDGELGNTDPWFGIADTGEIEYAHLDGAEGPQFIRQENQGGVLGIRMYCWIDFAVKAVGWKGLYKSTGV